MNKIEKENYEEESLFDFDVFAMLDVYFLCKRYDD